MALSTDGDIERRTRRPCGDWIGSAHELDG
jgi:hypothetical protein